MDFSIDSELLAGYINIIGKIIKAKSNLPILGNLYIKAEKDKIKLIGTDLEVQMVATLDAKVKSQSETTVNANLFIQYVNSLKGKGGIHIYQDKNLLYVETEGSSASFTTRAPEDFPLFDEYAYSKLFNIKSAEFTLMVDKTIFSCAKDDIRPILTGINVEISDGSLTFVSLDTFRLSLITTDKISHFGEDTQFVVPAEAMATAVKVVRDPLVASFADKDELEVQISKDKNFMRFSFANVVVYSRLLEGEYPNYKDIIPTDFKLDMTINKTDLLTALRRVGVFAQNAISQRVVFEFKDSKLTLSSVVPELGSVTETVALPTAVKENFKIAFQLKFLLEIINLIDDENIEMKGINKLSPVMFRQPSLKDSFLHLLMPLKLDE